MFHTSSNKTSGEIRISRAKQQPQDPASPLHKLKFVHHPPTRRSIGRIVAVTSGTKDEATRFQLGNTRSSRKSSTGVTGQFQISHPISRPALARSADHDRAFPIRQTRTHAANQLLRPERRS